MKTTTPSQILEHSSASLVVALSETEIGKILLPSPVVWVEAHTGKVVNFPGEMPTLESEVSALRFANAINDLLPKYIRTQPWQDEEGRDYTMLVMERLYPLPHHHFGLRVRRKMMERLEVQLKELHDGKFIHGDLVRPTNYFTRGDTDWMFRNIVQTETGLRLIDAGFGKIRNMENLRSWVHGMFREQEELAAFKNYYLKTPGRTHAKGN
jgi:hypothetical protein